eukprot:15353348-Heterocapsa_arctica.AAC.1
MVIRKLNRGNSDNDFTPKVEGQFTLGNFQTYSHHKCINDMIHNEYRGPCGRTLRKNREEWPCAGRPRIQRLTII